jgi:hypothetical protein
VTSVHSLSVLSASVPQQYAFLPVLAHVSTKFSRVSGLKGAAVADIFQQLYVSTRELTLSLYLRTVQSVALESRQHS